MTKLCPRCGQPVDRQHPAAVWCSDACKVAGNKARRAGVVVDLDRPTSTGPGPLSAAALAELTEAGQELSLFGVMALHLATRIESGQDTGSAMAAMVRELKACMALALADHREPDLVDELRARYLAKLHGPHEPT